ncbi:MAG TPA: hypothetical protein VGA60_13030 [Kiloniellales bacterium]|jgi:hypothetical protein
MMRIAFLTFAVAVMAGLALTVPAVQPAGATCQTADGMIENFLSLYPTGGPAVRFEGETGDQVEQKLAAGRDADEVVFLYSGHGPVTGARGRYMYLLLDPADCILAHGWIDGETFDRAVPAQ